MSGGDMRGVDIGFGMFVVLPILLLIALFPLMLWFRACIVIGAR